MTYIMSDIHGNHRRFRSVMAQIDLQPEDELYILGDFCDRYYGGIALVQELRQMPNVHMLYGNHEDMLRLTLGVSYDMDTEEGRAEYERRRAHWYRNGGELTHRELDTLPPAERREVIEFLSNLPVNVTLTVNGIRYLLTHAAPLDLYAEECARQPERWRDERYFAVWKRFTAEEPISQDYITIYGHTPTDNYQDCDPLAVWYGDHRIAIDCGCCFPEERCEEEPRLGRLACLRLEDGRVFYSQCQSAPAGWSW